MGWTGLDGTGIRVETCDDARVSSKPFSPGLLDHLQRHAGRHTGTEPAIAKGRNRGYALGFFEKPDAGMVTVISSGMRFKDVDVAWSEEVACTLQAAQAPYARFFVDIICEMILENNRGIEFDHVIDNRSEFIDGTRMEGLVASSHPYFDADFNIRFDKTGNVEMQVISLVPVTRAEMNFIKENDADSLYEIWVKEGADLLDVDRESAV
jgi:Suppressor of fused protein (SUFU)